MRPWLLRPPVFESGFSSDFSGVVRVISAKSATDEPRRPGVVGLYLRMAIVLFLPGLADSREDVDGAGLERDDGALGVLALAEAELGAARLGLTVDGVHRSDLDVEDLLDRELDLRLVRAGVDDERVLALVDQAVALLGDHGRDDDVARVLVVAAHAETSVFLVFAATKASKADCVKTMSSETSTSYAFSWSQVRTCSEVRLRTLFQATSSVRSRTTRTFLPGATRASSSAAVFVEGASPVTSESTTCMRPPRTRSDRAPRRAAAIIFLGVRCA